MSVEKSSHILLDLRWMIPGYTGGIEVMARSLLNTLLRIDATRQYTVLLPSVTRFDFDTEGRKNFHIQICDGLRHYLDKMSLVLLKAVRRDRVQRDEVWIQARRTRACIAISPSGIISPDLYPLKNLLILPDLQHEYFPDFFSTEELNNRRKYYNASLTHADQLITISEFTRRTIIEHMNFPSDKITVAYLGIDPRFRNTPQPSSQVLKKYNIEASGYLFYPANTWHHKNHRIALRALKHLKEKYHLTLLLVCTGTPKEAHADLMAISAQLSLQDQFRFLGYCPQDDLPALYHEAAALVFPSLFEGFGMPIIEAMSCDCPVICSNTTSLPEIAGNAAYFIDPQDPEMLAEAIYRVLTDSALRQDLIQRGRQRAKQFSWLNFTSQVLQSLRRLEHSISRG